MTQIEDRNNPSIKMKVNTDGSINTDAASDEALIIDDYTTTDVTYFGYAVAGSVTSTETWKIKRLDDTGNFPVFTWADGNTKYDNIWDDRTSLSYS